MNRELKEQLEAELIWALTRTGAFQRSRLYNKNATESKRQEFRRFIKDFLFTRIFQKYKGGLIYERALLSIIDKLVEETTKEHGEILAAKVFRFGNAQKFVNIYLKCMWLLGYIKAAPHFPVDRIIQRKLKEKVNWTNMNRKEYIGIIDSVKGLIKTEKKKRSLCEWEAETYFRNSTNTHFEL